MPLPIKQRQAIYDRFAPTTDPEETAKRIVDFSKFFLGDKENSAHYWIRDSVPPVHYKTYEALANEYKFYYITAPREFGKSTTVQLVYILYRIVYRLEPYILLIEKNEKAGSRVLSNIKYEIARNYKIKEVYGELKPERTRGDDDKQWSKSEARLRNGIFIRSVGMMGDVRGSLDRMYRFTMIVCNDPQNMKTMREPTTLEAHQEFWERDVEHALDHKHGKIRLVGNMLGDGCLLKYIADDPKYTGINFSALVDENGKPDINGRSIWESRFTTKSLHAERDNYKAKGKLHIFMAERMNIITDEGKKSLKGFRYHEAKFHREYNQNYITTAEYGDIPVNTYHYIDPAYASTENSDSRAGVTVALGRFPSRDYAGRIMWVNGIWVLEYFYDHSDPSLLIDRALDLHRKYYYKGLVIEANGPQQIYEYIGNRRLMQDEFVFKNNINFIPVKRVSGNKEDRIYESIQPKCKLGQFFIRPEHDELENELTLFMHNPQGIHILDAIEMGLRYSHVNSEQKKTYNDMARRYVESRTQPRLQDMLNNPTSILRQLGIG